MFLFGTYEGYQYVNALPGFATLPTAQEYQGDFSDLGQLVNGVCTPINIYDDGTGTPSGSSRPQFSNNGKLNVIPPTRLDPVAVAYAKLFYPEPNNFTGSYNSCTHANNYINALRGVVGERQGIVRGDYQASASDQVVARYSYYYNSNNNGGGVGFSPLYNYRYDGLQVQNAVLSETHVFKPTLLNDARIGMYRTDFPYHAATFGQNIAGTIGLPNDTGIELPVMSNGVSTGNATVGFKAGTGIEGIDDLTWQFKSHSLHVGATAHFC